MSVTSLADTRPPGLGPHRRQSLDDDTSARMLLLGDPATPGVAEPSGAC
jgi:hypothetical protein